MNLELKEIAPEDEAKAWSFLPNSPLQAVLHNELVRAIQSDLIKLATTDLIEVVAIQKRIEARKDLFGFIHRADKKNRDVNPVRK